MSNILTMQPPGQATADEAPRWMKDIARGDAEALQSLIQRWKAPLFSFFLRSTGSAQDAEELTFTTFEKIYRAADRYQPTASFPSWLFTIARNLLNSHFRFRSRRPRFAEPAADALPPEPEVPSERPLRETADWIEQALTAIPEKYRTPLLLASQEGLSHEEIATTLCISVANTKVRIHRARQLLRAAMEELV